MIDHVKKDALLFKIAEKQEYRTDDATEKLILQILFDDGYVRLLKSDTYFTSITSTGIEFMKRGAYSAIHLNVKEDNKQKKEKDELEVIVLKLQREEFEYNKTIRKQQKRIRRWQLISALLGLIIAVLSFVLSFVLNNNFF